MTGTTRSDVCFIVSQKPSMLTPRITPPAAAQKKTTQSTQTIYPNVVRIENGTVYRMTGSNTTSSKYGESARKEEYVFSTSSPKSAL